MVNIGNNVPNKIQYNGQVNILSNAIKQERKMQMYRLQLHPIPAYSFYTDSWTSPVGKNGFIDLNSHIILNGERLNLNMGVHEWQYVVFDALDFEQNEEKDLNSNNKSAENKPQIESDNTQVPQVHDALIEAENIQNKIDQEITQYLDEAALIDDYEPINNLDENVVDTETDEPSPNKPLRNDEKEWKDRIASKEISEADYMLLEFKDICGTKKHKIIMKKTALLIGKAIRKLLHDNEFNSYAANVNNYFRTKIVTDAGMFCKFNLICVCIKLQFESIENLIC